MSHAALGHPVAARSGAGLFDPSGRPSATAAAAATLANKLPGGVWTTEILEDCILKAATQAACQVDIVMDEDVKDEETVPTSEDDADKDPFPDVRDCVISMSKQGMTPA